MPRWTWGGGDSNDADNSIILSNEASPETSVPEASIDGTNYETLEAAILAANGKTITLLKDITREKEEVLFTIPTGSTITLDLAGHSIDGSIRGNGSNYSQLAVIRNEGTLTITDSGDNGSISNVNDYAHPRLPTIYNAKNSTLNIEGGIILSTNGCAIANHGICNIYSGTIKTTGGATGGWINATSCVDNRGTLVITTKDGLSKEPVFTTSWKAPIYSGGTTTITCGQFSSENWDYLIYVIDGETSVTGGTWVNYNPSEYLSDGYYVEASGLDYLVKEIPSNSTFNITASSYDEIISEYNRLIQPASSNITISDNIKLTGDLPIPFGSSLIIPAGYTLTVPVNTSLTIDGRLIIYGTLNLDKGYLGNIDRILIKDQGKIEGLELPSKDGVYIISTPAELQLFSSVVNIGKKDFAGEVVKLVADIDMSNYKFTPIGTSETNFKGTFDADGYKIKNLNICTAGSNAALFSYAYCATFKNIYLENCNFETVSGEIGFIVAHCNISGTFENIYIDENCSTLNTSSYYSGGICGALDNQNKEQNKNFYFINCSNHGDVTGAFNVGSMWGTSSRCTSDIYLINCSNHGNISATGGSVAIAGGYLTTTNSVYIYGFENKGTVSEKDKEITAYTYNNNSCIVSGLELIDKKCVAYIMNSATGALTGYVTINDAITAASEGDIINLFAGEYTEETITGIEKSFSIIGNESTIKGLSLSVASENVVNITISDVNFTEKGLYIYGANDVTIAGCTFKNINSTILTNGDEVNAIHLSWCTGDITIGGADKADGNTITNEMDNNELIVHKNRAIFIEYGAQDANSKIIIKNNTISNVAYNAIQVYSYAAKTIVENNTIEEWDSDNDSWNAAINKDSFAGGRAVRISLLYTANNPNPAVTVSNNTFIKDYLVDKFTSNLGEEENATDGYDDGNVLIITLATANTKLESLTSLNNLLVFTGIKDYYGDHNPLFIIEDKTNNKDDPIISAPTVVIFDPNGGYFDASSNEKIYSFVANGETVDEPSADPSRSSYKFVGWYDSDAVCTFPLEVTENLTLTANWRYTGGSGTPITPPTPPVTPEEPKEPIVPDDQGNAEIKVDEKKAEELVHEAVTSGSSSVTLVDKENIEGTVTSVTIPVSDLETISKQIENNQNIDSVSIATSTGEVIIEKDVLNDIIENANSETIVVEVVDAKDQLNEEQKKVVGDNPVYDVNIRAGSEYIKSFNGKTITVSIPYELQPGEDPNNLVVYYLKDDGTVEKMKGTYKDGQVSFETDHLSKFVIAYEAQEPVTPDNPDKPAKEDNDNTIYYAIAAIVVILIIVALAYYFLKKKQ
ncbi:InlB B-repeat-containing protein [Candidatus Methanomassiliicoccus intestinalis]|uniref:InlB B-repeat-containing protein n=1 Tax=Candidatus Methanomassiliicoccus intestinalis TaxID=1406512 RepID=UPI0037DD4215